VTELPIFAAQERALQPSRADESVQACDAPESAERDRIERAKRDPRALAALYREHYAPVAGYVYRRVGDVHVAEDLVAEVFLTVVRSLRQYRHRGVPFKAWLFRIATNTVNRWARQRRKRAARELARLSESTMPRGEPKSLNDPDAAVVRMAMLTLPPRYQSVLALHYLEGLSVSEVAATLGCRVGTVKSRLSRAREALRDRLEQGR
jgi:RNA polymerase sigma-70 factor (ECF subfamily)